MTLNTYSHIPEGAQAKAAATLNGVLKTAATKTA
jgi:hypothetical protein